MIKRFKYTKDNGEVTERIVAAFTTPSKYLFGIDVTNDEVALEALETLMQRQKEEMQALVEALELETQYRRFKEEGIEYLED